MEIPSRPRRGTAAAAAAVALLLAAPACRADVVFNTVGDTSIFVPPQRPSEPTVEKSPAVMPSSPSTDAPGEEGDLRLINREDVNGFATGSLQVFLNGGWGAVCNNKFSSIDADVACRQLGFVGGTDLPLVFRRSISTSETKEVIQGVLAPMLLENLECTGTEGRLADCPVTTDDDYGFRYDYTYAYNSFQTPSFCDPLQASYAFVACGTLSDSAEANGDLRLVGGMKSEDGNAEFGRLEVFNDGGWGTVCDSSRSPGFFSSRMAAKFSDASVDVACQQLGYREGSKTQVSGPTDVRVPTWIASASCGGSEDELLSCAGVSLRNGTEACGVSDALSILCFNTMDSDAVPLHAP